MSAFRDKRKNRQGVEGEAEEPMDDLTAELFDQLAGASTKSARTAKTTASEPQIVERVVEKIVEVPVEKEVIVEVHSPAIVPVEGGVWVGNFLVTSTGLEFPDNLTEDEWVNFFPAVQNIQSALNWILGDYFAYGQSVFQKTYDQMAAFTGLKSETIETYASICRNVPKLIRINSLSFGHHRLVAKFDEQTQTQWLAAAVNNKWSVSQMRLAIEGRQKPTLPPLADKKNRRILNRVWKAVENGGAGLDPQDILHLRRWLDEVERLKR